MTTDRLDQLRTEYAETGAVTSDGAVWLISQVVVLREQLVSRQAADAPSAPADQAERRDRYAVAIHDAIEPDLSLVDQEPGAQALFACAAEAAVAIADAEQAELLAADQAAEEQQPADAGLRDRVAGVLAYAEQVAATSGPGPASAVQAVIDRLRAALANEAQQPAPCEQHPNAPTFDGKCGGCTQYPADMVKAQPAEEDPARIDRIRPEFTEHSSIEAIDAQLRRARAQQRRWHLRIEWLISLRQIRVGQKARGEWPATNAEAKQQTGEDDRG